MKFRFHHDPVIRQTFQTKRQNRDHINRPLYKIFCSLKAFSTCCRFVLFCLFMVLSQLMFSCGNNETTDSSQSPTPVPTELVQSAQPAIASTALPVEPLAARWNGGKISLAQVDRILGPRKERILAAAKEIDPASALAKERRTILDVWVENAILIQEANARKLTLSPAVQDRLLREMKGKYNTEADYKNDLSKAGQSEEGLLKTLKSIELGRLCIDNETRKIKKSLTHKSIRKFYEKNRESYFTSPSFSQVNQVDIWAGEKRTRKEAETRARQLQQEVKDGMAAAKVNATTDILKARRRVIQDCAFKHSDSGDGSYNYGFVSVYHSDRFKEYYSQEFLDAVLNHQVGELSNVVETKNGYGFFFVMNKVKGKVQSFESESIKKMIPNMMIRFKMDEWREALKEKYHLKIFEDNLLAPGDVSKATSAIR